VDALVRRAYRAATPQYLRLSLATNAEPVPGPGQAGAFSVLRRGGHGTVVAVGPLLSRVLRATEGLDVTVLYATTVRPFDARTLRATLSAPDVAVVGPFVVDPLVAAASAALAGVPARISGIGAPAKPLRRYGTPAEHDAAYGLDEAALRGRLGRLFDPARRRADSPAP
jgi:transketolase